MEENSYTYSKRKLFIGLLSLFVCVLCRHRVEEAGARVSFHPSLLYFRQALLSTQSYDSIQCTPGIIVAPSSPVLGLQVLVACNLSFYMVLDRYLSSSPRAFA